MENKVQEIFEYLQSVIPCDWKKICMSAEINDESYDICYYVYTSKQNEPIQCFDLSQFYEIETEDVLDIFEKVECSLQSLKVCMIELSEKNNWTNYTLILNEDLSFNEYFDYVDDETSQIDYMDEWKKKYLN